MELAGRLNAWPGLDGTDPAVVKVPLSCLLTADSPRRSGESLEHIRRLAESEDPLPPIVVHRPTMRVLDGMHRLSAARLRGQQEIDVRYFDGDEASSFVLAVKANITHGLPLTLADRKVAAARIMSLYPQWSDRMIASVTGLAAKTVAAGRCGLSADKQQLDGRLGRDGRTRPVNGAERREIAARLVADNPGASLREVARAAGVSPETVRGVRARLQHGRWPAPPPQPGAGRATPPRPPRRRRAEGADANGASAVQALQADPAFRSNERTRSLLRMLSSCLVFDKDSGQLLESIPAHCLSRVAAAAQACAQGWQTFADSVEHQQERALQGTGSR